VEPLLRLLDPGCLIQVKIAAEGTCNVSSVAADKWKPPVPSSRLSRSDPRDRGRGPAATVSEPRRPIRRAPSAQITV